MARIIPTDDTPGAREAGTIDFVDRYLSGIGFIYAKPDGSGFEELAGGRRRLAAPDRHHPGDVRRRRRDLDARARVLPARTSSR